MAFTYTTRKDGRLMKKVTINGKPTYLYSYNKDDLERRYIEAKHFSYNGVDLSEGNITFEEYANHWFDINCSIKEQATQNSIKNRIRHINKYIGKIKLKNLKPFNIQEIVTQMVKEGYTDITKRTLAECKRILNDAVNNDIIQKNVANGITCPKFPKNERKPLSSDEDRKVYNLALNHKYGLFILVLRYCGLRPEEAVALTINDVDFNSNKLIVNKAVSLAKNQPTTKPTKNLKNRKIPIPSFLIPMLKQRIDYCNENQIIYIFTKETDNLSRLTKTALRTHLDTFLNELNGNSDNKITFSYYQLRHSYCTMLYYAGIKIKKAQELMGHSSAKLVYDIYTHLDEERESPDELINNYIDKKIIE